MFVANKKVLLIEYKTKVGYIGGGTTKTQSIITSGFTDANGQIVFGDFDTYKNKNYEYYIEYDYYDKISFSDNGIKDKGVLGNDPLDKGTDNNVLININQSSIFTINFTPPPPYNGADYLRLDLTCPLYTGQYDQIHLDNTNYSNYHKYSVYRGTYYYNIDKFKSGVYTNTKDTVLYDIDSTYIYNVNW